ncbi:MAG: endonuclease/exonuclease/phosphatase family protein [Bacteroidetes bacterium]|nr:endonuclease/exonuclease/phosphatase family protein [Bacteroidota bacterium]
MKRRSILIKVTAWIFLIPASFFLAFVLFLTVADYHPAEKEAIRIIPRKGVVISKMKREITFLTWNIGYAGLGQKMDFFYEGGTRVRPERNEFEGYMEGISRFLASNDSVDFVFIEEADVHSRRSYFTDEVSAIAKALHGRISLFAKNYDCRFVPVPLDDPMGRVVSGIACYPRFIPGSAVRIDLGTRFSWPKQLVMLKRCILVMRYELTPGNQLVVVTLHNSTFDKEGELRKKELQKLNDLLTKEYSKGNYVIAGGDWNINPRGFRPETIITGDRSKAIDPPLDPAFLPGWQFAFDAAAPSNRDVEGPYLKGKTKTTIIDFFVVSPNVGVQWVRTLPTGFRCSDHQPVIMKVRLK